MEHINLLGFLAPICLYIRKRMSVMNVPLFIVIVYIDCCEKLYWCMFCIVWQINFNSDIHSYNTRQHLCYHVPMSRLPQTSKYKFLVNNDLFHTCSDTIMLPIESNDRDIIYMVRCRFSTFDFLQNPCFRHSMAHSCGPAVGCLLWGKVETLIYVLFQLLQYCMQYRIILERVVTAPDYIYFNV